MNTIDPPSLPDVPASPIRADSPSSGPPVRLVRLLSSLALAIAVYDLCFWRIGATPGISVGLFFMALSGIILANRETRGGKVTLVLVALMAGAAVESAIETCVTNTLVLLSLTVALAGESYFREFASSWGRWMSQVIALVFAPGRIFWLGGRLFSSGVNGGLNGAGGVIGAFLLAIPAGVLALIFGCLLASGNAVFGSWTETLSNWLWNALARCLDPLRIMMWMLVGFAVLPLLRPAQIAERWWKWTTHLPRLPEMLPSRAAFFSSALVLVVLNLLFLAANVADALFLWTGRPLPAGVSYTSYVHEGVNVLITTVILSAVVLTVIFQQALNVVARLELKVLACLWIAQNLFLICSVAEKLRRYILTYEMTVERLGTLIFLVLVLAGFALLAIKVMQDRSISWLIGGCILAVFFTFYVTQFLDLAGWSANYNVARMEADKARVFDCRTMCQWGADVWPALRRAHDLTPDNPDISTAMQQASQSTDYLQAAGRDAKYWREFGLRAYWNRGALDEK